MSRGAASRIGSWVAIALLVVIGMHTGTASAKVFASQQQALAEAFPDAERIERKTILLGRDEIEAIGAITRQKEAARILVVHTAYDLEDRVLGFAHIDVHVVRTKPEAFMIVLTPEGKVRSVRILAFHEPLDYLPTDRWYAQFAGKTITDRLRVGGDVHAVAGATLSARAAADGVRRMLAYWKVLLRPSLRPGAASDGDEAAGHTASSGRPSPGSGF